MEPLGGRWWVPVGVHAGVCVYVHALLGVCVHGYVICCGSFIGIPIGGVYV